jgi:hypothetical protein
VSAFAPDTSSNVTHAIVAPAAVKGDAGAGSLEVMLDFPSLTPGPPVNMALPLGPQSGDDAGADAGTDPLAGCEACIHAVERNASGAVVRQYFPANGLLRVLNFTAGASGLTATHGRFYATLAEWNVDGQGHPTTRVDGGRCGYLYTAWTL